MNKAKPYISDDGEVRDLDKSFFKAAKRGRPPMPASDRKVRTNLMLDPDVIEKLKAGGNMSSKANRLLRKGLGL